MKKLQVEQNLHQEKVSGLVVLVLLAVVGLLALGRVFMANRLVETSQLLRNLDQEITETESANQVLAQEVRGAQAIGTAQKKLAAAGFVSTSSLSYVSGPAKVAFRSP